ncbi:inositol monophosphatase [Nocardioides sp. YIM 152315]|uniref:inositol monophosphatase family protein n=1 Tax=Nocardioides sp. YIM 152315 TaxID=3031760 RepID=UPI0023DC5C51|nr:inositol monophosphatase [Nocardioides sp. YIM 152315]MDF1602125.1 inositol monophosphatase [Nocardioides sp. YIM 152315]
MDERDDMDDLDDLEVAFRVADRAAELALSFFRAGVTTASKADGSPVTEADRAVERLVRAQLGELRPDDALLGEEYGQVDGSERVWIVDPIDGTTFFSRRDPNWRVHLALAVDGVVELAVVTSPALGLRWWATRGGGAVETAWPPGSGHARRLAVSTTSSLADAALDALSTIPPEPSPARFRPPCTPLPLVELVRGAVDGVLAEGFAAWDHAPWILLVQEAGGRFTDPTGGAAYDRGGGLYSNAVLHEALVAAVRRR